MRGWKSRLLIAVSTVLLTLLSIEIAVRVIPLYPDTFEIYDPDLGWRMTPNKSGTYLNILCLGEFTNRVTLNSHGLHDVEHSYEPPTNNTYRILMLGDSMVAALEVPLEQAFFRRLEAQLNDVGDISYEVIAAGHHGYSTSQELWYYEKEGRRYQPDLVILVIQPANDFLDNHASLRLVGTGSYPYYTLDNNNELMLHTPSIGEIPANWGGRSINPLHDTLYQISYLYRLLFRRIDILKGIQENYDDPAHGDDPQRLLDEAWAITRAVISQLKNEVEADGAQFAVVIAPGVWRTQAEGESIYADFEKIMNDLGIPYLNLAPTFQASQSSSPPLIYACDHHWTARGHQLVADELTTNLTDLIQETR